MLGIDLVQQRVAGLKQRYPQVTVEFVGSIFNKVLHYRNTHRIVAPWLAGQQVGTMPPIPTSRYRVFHWWLPDSERIRKITEFQNEALHEELGLDKFSDLSQKYDSGSRLTNPAPGQWLDRSEEEGRNYRLWERLGRLTEELMDKVGIKS